MAELQDVFTEDKTCNEKEFWSLIFKENIADRHWKLETEQQEIRGIITQTTRPGAAD